MSRGSIEPLSAEDLDALRVVAARTWKAEVIGIEVLTRPSPKIVAAEVKIRRRSDDRTRTYTGLEFYVRRADGVWRSLGRFNANEVRAVELAAYRFGLRRDERARAHARAVRDGEAEPAEPSA